MNKISIIFILIFQFGWSQDLPKNVIKEFERNLVAYKIRYIYDDSFCFSNFNEEIGRFYLESQEEYIFDFHRVDNLYYPQGKLQLYAIFDNYYQKRKFDSQDKYEVEFIHGIGYSTKLSSKGLIGISDKNEVFYIAGPVFKNCIAKDFNLNLDKKSSFNDFLKMKLFNYKISNIKFKKRRKKFILFKAYSDSLKGNIYIKIDTKDYDNIHVKAIDSGWTERGSYEWKKRFYPR